LFGQEVAAIIEIGCAYALNASQFDSSFEQARAFHADTDDAEPNAIRGVRLCIE
jgi:hypothetical protein